METTKKFDLNALLAQAEAMSGRLSHQGSAVSGASWLSGRKQEEDKKVDDDDDKASQNAKVKKAKKRRDVNQGAIKTKRIHLLWLIGLTKNLVDQYQALLPVLLRIVYPIRV